MTWRPADILSAPLHSRLAGMADADLRARDRFARWFHAALSRRNRRWSAAATAAPGLAADLIDMGHVLSIDAPDEALPVSGEQLAYDAGRRDLALELLALMHVTPHDLNLMMQEVISDVHDHG